MELLSYIKEWIEYLYYMSGIGMLITIFIGLRQLKLVKADIKVKNQRAAAEKTMDFLAWFSEKFVKKYSNRMREINREKYDEKLSNFNYNEYVKKNYILNENEISDEAGRYIQILGRNEGVDTLNELEYMSFAFVQGVADEEIAFNSLSNLFCEAVEQHYILLMYYRSIREQQNLYSNVTELYEIWNTRIQNDKKDLSIKQLNEQVVEISNTKEVEKKVKKIDIR